MKKLLLTAGFALLALAGTANAATHPVRRPGLDCRNVQTMTAQWLCKAAPTIPAHAAAAREGNDSSQVGPLVVGSPYAKTRVILLHGLNGTPASMLTAPYDLLTLALARRYQVIIPDEPFDQQPVQSAGDASWFASGPSGAGIGYRKMWLHQFHRLTAWANRLWGVKRLVVAGISWGGMHAMLAACYDPEVQAFAVSSPVVNSNALVEFSGLPELSALDPNLNGCARRLDTMPGFIGWGDADTRVGTIAVRRLLHTDSAIHPCRYQGLGHISDAETEHNMVLALRGMAPTGCYHGPVAAPDIG